MAIAKQPASATNPGTPLGALLSMHPDALLQTVLKEKWRRSVAKFIEEAVYIYDKDRAGTEEGIAIPFLLWPDQKDKALQAFTKERLTIAFKSRQVGITWLALAYSLHSKTFKAGWSTTALSQKETPEAKELVKRTIFMLQHLPSWLVVDRNDKKAVAAANERADEIGYERPMLWEATTLDVIIHHPPKAIAKRGKVEMVPQQPATFKSLTSAPGSARSLTGNLLILDEWAHQEHAEEIWASAFPTINRPTGGQVIGLSSFLPGTLFEQTWKDAVEGLNGFFPLFLSVWADPRRDEAWYQATKAAMPNKYRQEYPRTPEEAMSAGEGQAFPEFSREIHVVPTFEPPHWWRRWRSNDPGYTDPFAWYWFAVGEDGTIYIYREYTRDPNSPRVVYSDQAKRVTKLSIMREPGPEPGDERVQFASDPLAEISDIIDVLTGRGSGSDARTLSYAGDPDDPYDPSIPDGYVAEPIEFTVAGRDAFTKHAETGKAIVDYYMDGGVHGCIPPNTDRALRRAVWHEYLKPFVDANTGRTTSKVKIMDCCKKLIEIMPQLLIDEKEPEKVKGSPIDHCFDSSGYGLVAWHAERSTAPAPPKSRIQRDKERLVQAARRRTQRRL